MAKPTAPLMSFGVEGTLDKNTVFGKYKGKQTARQHVTPKNPKSAGQTQTRTTLATGNRIYKVAGPLLKASWNLFAKGKVLTGYNKFVGNFVSENRGEADLQSWNMSVEALGGPRPPPILVTTPSPGTLRIRVLTPTPPTGWTQLSAIAAVIEDQNPQTAVFFESAEFENPFGSQVPISGLKNGVLYVCGGWLKWQRPDGQTAYSKAEMSTKTTT